MLRAFTAPTANVTTRVRNFVVKRNGVQEPFHFDKITARVERLMWNKLGTHVDATLVTQGVVGGMFPGITTAELDNQAADVAESFSVQHPDYSILAARIAISRLHKMTNKTFSTVARQLMSATDKATGVVTPMLADDVFDFIQENAAELDSAIVHDRDFLYDFFGFKTVCRSCLLKVDGVIVERPQHMLMRVACGTHCGDVAAAIESYNSMSLHEFTHASPTLYNAGTSRPQCSSCFLGALKEDSIDGIYDTLKDCARISKHSGGIGLAMHTLRAKGSAIRGGGVCSGIVPCLRNFHTTARYVDQGGGKRKGAISIYNAPWHADFVDTLELKKNTGGNEEQHTHDLHFGAWVPDLFMERVEKNQDWSMFCPHDAPGLEKVFGEEFREKYEEYESRPGLVRKRMPARKLMSLMATTQTETGEPYMLYSDACNLKSNQQHSGPILSSNLCTEILEISSPTETAVCNLASISLPAFVTDDGKGFDFVGLRRVTKIITRNLNKIIDRNFYPVPEAKYSNLRHRPIGIGVQGLADVFLLMRMPFDSQDAAKLDLNIFESIYFAACEASCELAERDGPYETFAGSPMSKGQFQFNLWGTTPHKGSQCDWDTLRTRILLHGVRNSLLVALMPTASTSQMLGNNECFEPYTSNLYARSTLAGSFTCINRHLVKDLVALGLWSAEIRNKLLAHNGSVQNIDEIPQDLKLLYRTAFELDGKVTIDLAAARGIYICHSQSLNVHMKDVTPNKLMSMHFYAWKKGLKTGMYYLRTLSASDAIKFTVDAEMLARTSNVTKRQNTLEEEEEPNQSSRKRSRVDTDDLSDKKESTTYATKHECANNSSNDAIHEDQDKFLSQMKEAAIIRRQIMDQEQANLPPLSETCSWLKKEGCQSCSG